jgi:hypothetical protein
MDIITIVGTSSLLYLWATASGEGPPPDQCPQIATLVVTVLVAQVSIPSHYDMLNCTFLAHQAAFAMAIQQILPDVSYMTIMDIHNNVCFM